MPEFILLCRDRRDGFDLRTETRDAHLGYIKNANLTVLLAGPLLDDKARSAGSLIIIEAPDIDAAETFAANDPYALAGLFEAVEIKPYRIVTGALAQNS